MPIDPEKLRKSYEALKSIPVKPLRSKLAPAADIVLELHAKGYPFREIVTWLAEHLDQHASISTLHAFYKAAEKRRAQLRTLERQSHRPTPAPAKLAPTPAQNALPPARDISSREEAKAAIRAVKTRAQTGEAKAEQPFDFDPAKPLLSKTNNKPKE